ncbi:MAG: glycosyltransferase family 2 protein [Burkholderiales bacterium]|nr:glycosyltransferase family 2 protein [Burkholderiales bacterium]
MKTLGGHDSTPVASFAECAVVIVNYNAGVLLADCVASVIAEGVHRIIVVDNASGDGSLEAMERINQNKNPLAIIRNQANLGFAKACNLGIEATSAGHILFLNPDSVLSKGALGQLISTLESSPSIGMVGGFLSNPDGSEQPGGRRVFPTPKRAFMRAFGLSRLAKFFPEVFSDFLLHKEALPEEPVAVEAISGACMLVKREAIEDVGLWDDNYFLHCEDLDWCMRFRKKGWKVMFVPDAKIVHVWGACSRSRPIFVEWHKHHGMLRFYRKFFRHQYPGALWALVTVGVWLRFSLVASYYSLRHVMAVAGLVRE